MLALIDADIVAYRCAASCQKSEDGVVVLTEPFEVAQQRANDLMHRILQETSSDSYKAFASGSKNFRYDVYPEYKANRKKAPRPEYLEDLREYLVADWNVKLADGVEADDMLGIEQTACNGHLNKPSIICSIDKDLLQVPGRHYNFVKAEFYDISPVDGLRNFWFQMIMGDRSDNIPGYDGIMRQKVPKFLQPKVDFLMSLENDSEMSDFVYHMYRDHNMADQFEINKQLLFILREPIESQTEGEESERAVSVGTGEEDSSSNTQS